MHGVLIKCPEFFSRPVHLREIDLSSPQDFFYLNKQQVQRILKCSETPQERNHVKNLTTTDLAVLKFLDSSGGKAAKKETH
jgi:hydroxyacyl-ACP dehydratase HTD2-like protein with hotdog domain